MQDGLPRILRALCVHMSKHEWGTIRVFVVPLGLCFCLFRVYDWKRLFVFLESSTLDSWHSRLETCVIGTKQHVGEKWWDMYLCTLVFRGGAWAINNWHRGEEREVSSLSFSLSDVPSIWSLLIKKDENGQRERERQQRQQRQQTTETTETRKEKKMNTKCKAANTPIIRLRLSYVFLCPVFFGKTQPRRVLHNLIAPCIAYVCALYVSCWYRALVGQNRLNCHFLFDTIPSTTGWRELGETE